MVRDEWNSQIYVQIVYEMMIGLLFVAETDKR